MYDFTCRITRRGSDLVTDADEARLAIDATLGDRDCERVGLANWRVPLTDLERARVKRDGILRFGMDPQVVFRRRWRTEATVTV